MQNRNVFEKYVAAAAAVIRKKQKFVLNVSNNIIKYIKLWVVFVKVIEICMPSFAANCHLRTSSKHYYYKLNNTIKQIKNYSFTLFSDENGRKFRWI